MAREMLTNGEAIEEFWSQLKDRATVMLSAQGSERAQPMTSFSEPENGVVWFFTRDDTDLAMEAAGRTDGRMIFVKPDKFFADVSGAMSIDLDRGRIDRYWNPVVAAWYPDGKNDPHLTLLRFTPKEGQVWISQQGPVGFAIEIAKANVKKHQPDLGGSAKVTF